MRLKAKGLTHQPVRAYALFLAIMLIAAAMHLLSRPLSCLGLLALD